MTKTELRLRKALSPREMTISNALVMCDSYREVAEITGLSESVVKVAAVSLFEKVGVNSKLGCVLKLIRHGILTCPCGANGISDYDRAQRKRCGPTCQYPDCSLQNHRKDG